MPLADDLMALAALAGNTVVAAVATDAWDSVRHGVGHLFGRGGPREAELAAQRLEETRRQLAAVTRAELEQARAVLAQRWAARLADLLEDDPGAEAGLRALVGQAQAQLVFATGHSAAAGRDLTIETSGGGVAAGVMHASIVAGMGGTAIGRVEYHRPQAASQPVSLAPRPVFLAGREELLAELDRRLSAGDGLGPKIVALCGLGGAGKTAVTVEYAHRHLAEVGLAWQFPAEDPAVLLAEFARLAAQLGAREVVDARDPVASVHGVLAVFPAEWLLVFDNAMGYEAVRGFLPPAGTGRVLITSQSTAWPPGWGMEVPVLDTEVAAEFLVNRTGDPDETAGEELAGELGGLPLALEQAAAYIQATGATLAGYAAMFQERREDLLARGQAAGHPADVAATLGLALSQLRDEAAAAAGLLRLLACLAPEPVPLALLLADAQAADQLGPSVAADVGPLLGDPIALGDAVAALRRYSLVTPAGDGLVLVHRLVQAITRAQLSPEAAGQWKQAAAALVDAAVPADARQAAHWRTFAVLLPHARAVLNLTSGGMSRIAQYLGFSGSYLTARDMFQRIADVYRESDAHGPEHPDTLGARHELGRWTGAAGDAAGARDQLAALLPVMERVEGPEHPHTLWVRGNLARWTGEAGDAAGARDQFATLLPVMERVEGPEHPRTLWVRGNLARWTGEAGDAARARDQAAALLPIVERVLGPEYRDTLTARHSLAQWTGEAGDAARARDQYAALVPIMERVEGPEHRNTLNARHSLALWTGEAGDVAGARDQFAAVLPILERALGSAHPHTLWVRGNLARWTGEAGDAAGARDQAAALLPVVERVLGAEHPDTLTARDNLAFWTGQAAPGPG
jgi:Tetratricopeptide repeat